MSAIELSDRMAILLHYLARCPLAEADLERLRRTPEWIHARAWGWVDASGELTGDGHRHARDLTSGASDYF
jgi:hypothetical protein